MASGVARFRQAINAARSLHPDVLSQSQKLRLYALFRQSQGPADDVPPAEKNALAQAKWEAWRDVKGLSQAEAMDAYSEIIEGLVAMMAAFDDGGDADESPQDTAIGQRSQNGLSAAAAADEDEDEDEDEDDEDESEDDDEFEVTQTVWSTESVSVPPGGTFEVPLAFDASSRCTYSFSVVEGSTGPVGFSIGGAEGGKLVSLYKNDGEGSFEVSLPQALSSAVLTAVIDNTASTFSSIEVTARVCLEPLAELHALENYRARAALRGLIARKRATLEAHTRTYAKVGREAQELAARAARLREELARAEGDIKIKYKQLEQGAEMAEIMGQEIHELDCQLRAAP